MTTIVIEPGRAAREYWRDLWRYRELLPIDGEPTKRAFSAFLKAYEKGLLIRTTGDIIALSPPLIIEKSHIDELIGKLRDVLVANA